MDFASFENKHRNAHIVVCGLGESLNLLNHPQKFLTIGVNDIGRKFHPTYLLNVNLQKQYKGDRFSFIEGSKARAIFTHLPNQQGKPAAPVVSFLLGKSGDVDYTGGRLPHYRNSPYMAVCLAAYMGARKIGLIGVDFTDNHFWVKDGTHRLAREIDHIDKAYGRLAAHLRTKGIQLVNYSPTSKITSVRKEKL